MLNHRFLCVELTRRCNNHCLHCYNFWRKDGSEIKFAEQRGVLSRPELKELIRKVKKDTPLTTVALSGGEPLLRRDLAGITADVIDEGLQPVIITNGVLLTEEKLKSLPSGIVIEVSLLGHTAAIHDGIVGRKVFDRVIWNVSRIHRYGSEITIAFVATRENALDAYRTIELGIALGASGFLYNRVSLTRNHLESATQLVPSVDILRESLRQAQDAARKYGVTISCSVPIPPCVVDPAEFPDLHFGWCPRGGEDAYYTVDVSGQLRPCNHASEVIGDLTRDGFEEIVRSPASEEYWRSVPPECAKCRHPLRQSCAGGCPAAAREFFGISNRIDPFCSFANLSN